jgi:outer membrane murein-binding lipoprotein Lpp
MSDNILQTLQHLVQDVIAPDVRELKANQSALEKQINALEKHMDVRFTTADQKNDARFEAVDTRFNAVDARFDALDKKSDAQFSALLSAISESRAQAELTNLRVIASLSERVAVLEAQRH